MVPAVVLPRDLIPPVVFLGGIAVLADIPGTLTADAFGAEGRLFRGGIMHLCVSK